MENIAKNLRTARGKEPRKDVAEAVGVSVSAIQMYECGQRIPRDETKKKLAAHYGTTVQALFFN